MAEVSTTYSMTSPCFQPLSVSMGQSVASTTPFGQRLVGFRLAHGHRRAAQSLDDLRRQPGGADLQALQVLQRATGFLVARMPGPWA